jgi:Sec-independent protein secretion pathway component TatC
MTATNDPTPPPLEYAKAKKRHFDPDDFRMSIGDHLEELRFRLIRGLFGLVIACVICFVFGEHVVRWFCKPLVIALVHNKLPPQVYVHEAAESFMTYVKIAMICAATLAGPWLLYQLWLFVAAGLYPRERKYVTRYLPLSITLFVTGVLFLYYYVLPLMLEFFIAFNMGSAFKFPDIYPPTSPSIAATQPAVRFPVLNEDPKDAQTGTAWIDARTGLFKICVAPGQVRVIPFGSDSLVTPLITLGTYIDMVVGMLLSFGVAFQMPLIVLALNKIGIMDLQALRKFRRIVYFSMTIIAAVIVPDVATGMVALLIPLVLLYEFGILLAAWSQKKAEREADAT